MAALHVTVHRPHMGVDRDGVPQFARARVTVRWVDVHSRRNGRGVRFHSGLRHRFYLSQ